jgi:hypothetical protein
MPLTACVPEVIRSYICRFDDFIQLGELNFTLILEGFDCGLFVGLIGQINNVHANVWNLISVTCAECRYYVARVSWSNVVMELDENSAGYETIFQGRFRDFVCECGLIGAR